MRYYLTIILIISLLIGGAAVYGSDISEADFWGVITTSNNSTTASGVSSNISNSIGLTANLISGVFLNSGATNLAIQNSAGADIAFMPGYNTNPWVIWNGDLAANSVSDSILYVKNVIGGKLSYFPGNNGMTVSDNNTNLEPSNNSTIEISGYIDTAAGENKAIASHYDPTNGGVKIFVSPKVSGNVTARIYVIGGDYPVISSNATGVSTAATTTWQVTLPTGLTSGDLLLVYTFAYNTGGAITQTAPASLGMTQLFQTQFTNGANFLNLATWYKVATGGEISANWTLTNSWFAYQTYRIGADTFYGIPVVGTSATGSATNPDPPSLTSGFGAVPTLWFSLTGCETSAITNAPTNYGNLLTNATAGGWATIGSAPRFYTSASDDPGIFAPAELNWIANTIAIEALKVTELSVAGIPSGEYLTRFQADGVNMWLTVGDYVSANYTAISIPNSTASWILCSANTTPYVEYAKITISGTPQGYWYWEYGATFTDHTNGQYGYSQF